MVDAAGMGDGADPVVEEIVQATRASDFSRAAELANAALLRGFRHPALFDARAMFLEQHDRQEEALADLECIHVEHPRDPLVLDRIGNCLLKLDRWRHAAAAFDSAIAADPRMATSHYGKGIALGILGDIEAMQSAHEHALALKPDYADALGSLAMLATRQGKIGKAKTYAQLALAADPRQQTAVIALAMTDLAGGDIAAAEVRLRAVLADPQFGTDIRATGALGVLADTLDHRDRTAAAFVAYDTLNKKRRSRYAARFEPARGRRYAARLIDYFDRSRPWTAAPKVPVPAIRNDEPAGHVFLLGFPRTGTTLLESALARNARVAALDENDCLVSASQSFLVSDAGLDRLAVLGENQCAEWRNAYWKTVREERGISVKGKVFVDKAPFRSLQLPLIPRLFPQAKVLFAIRDPRDVVLSCFRKRFEMSPFTFEFLLLDDCARFYDDTMKLVQCVRRKLPLDLREHRYEDIVTDFDCNVRGVCDFVGIDWNESMRDFKDTADTTINARSLSASQVRRGLNRSGIGRWRRYAEQMAPVLPLLRPWVELFGYPPD